MLAGWREQGLAPSVAVDPAPEARALAGPDLAVYADAASLPAGFRPEAVVLAIKPQIASFAIPEFRSFGSSAVFLSIMAGQTLGGLSGLLGPACPIVRAMPNTPAAVRRGVSVAFAGQNVTGRQQALCETLLASVGRVAWVDDEGLLDPVTAVSGSGPAYVFLLVELLERAAIRQGIPAELARMLARETVIGSGVLLAATANTAAELRRGVTSPGGTTERALAVLMADAAWPALVDEAVAAATARSRELAR